MAARIPRGVSQRLRSGSLKETGRKVRELLEIEVGEQNGRASCRPSLSQDGRVLGSRRRFEPAPRSR